MKSWMVKLVLVLSIAAIVIGSGVNVQIDSVNVTVEHRIDEDK